jgi:hypothetical protein
MVAVNLFALDEDPILAAESACNQHIVKMPTETAQMLCYVTARHNPDQDWGTFPRRHADGTAHPYRTTGSHRNHPCTLWAGETQDNWKWVVEHGLAMCAVYTRRYSKSGAPPKIHKAQAVIEWCRDFTTPPPAGDLQPFTQAMPEEFRCPNGVDAYRNFYLGDKARFATWRPRAEPPTWWPTP